MSPLPPGTGMGSELGRDASDELGDKNDAVIASRANASVNSRRRALSVASTQPSVETVVAKAKRAASSLWLLLHAQVSLLSH